METNNSITTNKCLKKGVWMECSGSFKSDMTNCLWGTRKDFIEELTFELDLQSGQFSRVKERHSKYGEQHTCQKCEAIVKFGESNTSRG